MSTITVLKGIGAYTVLASAARETSETVYKDDSLLHSVSDEAMCLGTIWRNFKAKLYSSRNLITSTIRKSAGVSLRQQDQESRKELAVAKSAKSQSWLRYEAVTAGLRSKYRHRGHHEDALDTRHLASRRHVW